MRQAGDRSADALGWLASVLIHALTLGAAIVLAADFSLIPRSKPFQWEVSLVAAPHPESIVSDLPQASQASPASSSLETDSRISKSDLPQRADRRDVNNTERSRPGPKPEVDPPAANLHTEEVAMADLVYQDSLVQKTALSPIDPEPDTDRGESAELVENTHENDTDSVPFDLASLPVSRAEPDDILPPPDMEEPPTELTPVSEPAIQEPDRLAYRPAPQFQDPIVSKTLHADYGWLAKDIFAKVEKLKRYPYLAKTNRWQGNVVLQAVISDDGGVSDIQVVESSGHAMLDRDAIDLLAQVSPIRLKHPLGQSHIVVQIPIGYRLE
jgi:periplasmic protein TonB